MKLIVDGKDYDIQVKQNKVFVDNCPFSFKIHRKGPQIIVDVNGRTFKVEVKGRSVVVDGSPYTVDVAEAREKTSLKVTLEAPSKVIVEAGAIKAMMPGKINSLRVKEGERVTAGTVLLVIEAMKMENEVRSPKDGIIKRVAVSEGMTVNSGDLLLVVE